MMSASRSERFKLSYTSIALGLREAGVVLSYWNADHDWEAAGEIAVEDNAFQKSSSASTRRIFREIRQRLQTLTPETLEQFEEVSIDDQKAILLLAACKCYSFLFDFVRTTLTDKLVVFDYRVNEEDFDKYWNYCTIDHPELEDIADSTRKKIRQVTFRILVEAGLLSSTRCPQMSVVNISPVIEHILDREGPHYRQVFLTT